MITRRLHELTVERLSYELKDIEMAETNVRASIQSKLKSLENDEKFLASVLEKKDWCMTMLGTSKDALIALDGK